MSSTALKYTNKLQGSRILVLGASTGIGFCVAEAALEHGAHVIISSSNQKKLDNALARLQDHARAIGISPEVLSAKTCDLANPDTMEESILSLYEFATKNGKLDHVALTAGDSLTITALEETTIQDIQKATMVRFNSAIILAKHLPKYINQAVKSSFTLTGGSNSWRPNPQWAVIAGIGGSVEAFARGAAVDLHPIRVNAVQPGAVHTELFDSIPKDRLDAVLKSMAQDAVTNTVGSPQDVAEAYMYIMKDAFTTGGVVESNGGRLVGQSRAGFLWEEK